MRSIDNSKKGTKNCLNNLIRIGIRIVIVIRIREKGFFVRKVYFRDLIIQIALRGCASDRSNYKNYIIFEDPRIKNTLARAIIEKSKIKEFLSDLDIELSDEKYLLEKKLFNLGIPSKDIIKLQNEIFSLEANFLELNGIDQKKGCYIGQENTARMYLKNKVNKRLFALQIIKGKVEKGQKITLGDQEIGKVLIDDLFPFALIKINKDNKNSIVNKELKTNTAFVKINVPNWMAI